MISFWVDLPGKLRIAAYEGVVDDKELLAAYGQLLAQSDYDAGLDDLVDFRKVQRFDVSSSALRRLIQMYGPFDQLGLKTKLALVANSDLTFGMCRMFQLLQGDENPREIQVFRDYELACDWLHTRSCTLRTIAFSV